MHTETDPALKRRGRKPKTNPIEGREVTEENNNDVNAELIDANQSLGEANEKLANENQILRSEIQRMLAINNPVVKNHYGVSEEKQVGHNGRVDERESGFILPECDLDNPIRMKKLEYEAFMAETVEVEILTNPQFKNHIGFSVEVNGQKENFYQGQRKKVKRYFIEGLARAKATGYTNSELDPRTVGDGENSYEYRASTGVRFPFAVVNDSQRGRSWLDAVLRQP